MAISYKGDSRKLYKLTFMSVFLCSGSVGRKNRFWTFLKACATRVHETEVLKHSPAISCWFWGSGAGCCKAIGRARLAKFSVPTAENPWLSDVNTKKSKLLGKHRTEPCCKHSKKYNSMRSWIAGWDGWIRVVGGEESKVLEQTRVCFV